MKEYICSQCFNNLQPEQKLCSGCGQALVYDGCQKNILDTLSPNCLIHRYDGSDLLEPAVIIKECKTNMKVATRLQEYRHPVSVPKNKVFRLEQPIFEAIQTLRQQRTQVMNDFDQQIQSHWQHLQAY